MQSLSMKDIVFIGTSPINLLKGYLVGKENPETRIIFVDAHNRLGGAWYSDTSPKGHEIECGCHIWTYCPEVYEYIENELKIEMEQMSPSPVFKYKGMSLSYPLYTKFNSYRFLLKKTFTFNAKALKGISSNPEISYKLFGKKNRYPVQGSPIIISTLKSLMDKMTNIEFIYGKEITSVDCGDRITISMSDEKLKCDELNVTSVSSLKSIIKGSRRIDITHSRRDYIHVLVESDKKPKRKVTYDRLINDPIMHRICDISYQTKGEEHLYLVGILEEPFAKMETQAFVDALRNYLLGQKVIDESYNLSLVKTHVFPTYYINEKEREEVKNIDERIKLFYSVDLMYGFYYILREHGLIR